MSMVPLTVEYLYERWSVKRNKVNHIFILKRVSRFRCDQINHSKCLKNSVTVVLPKPDMDVQQTGLVALFILCL